MVLTISFFKTLPNDVKTIKITMKIINALLKEYVLHKERQTVSHAIETHQQACEPPQGPPEPYVIFLLADNHSLVPARSLQY